MARRRLTCILALTLLVCTPLQAQENSGNSNYRLLFEQADDDYEIGRFNQVLTTLEKQVEKMSGSDKQRALRLIALCYLAMYQTEKAEAYAQKLILENRYYSNVDDPIDFTEIINRLKAGYTTTITTASSIKESVEEAPAPVTIITAEMIENLGYNKRLGQILATYVPGMSEVYENTFDNMSMHGAYSNRQELILVMENGHRLNNRLNNGYAMDYSISTDKIDRIEVLRGPASSLYGNVALSAVVNIITKSGRELNGVKMKYGHGAFGTHRADITMGTRFMDADIFVWGALYQSDGQYRQACDSTEYSKKFFFPHETGHHSYVDGYKGKPTYDIGMTLKYKGFSLLASRKNSKKLAQYGSYGYYDYDKYRPVNNIYPGSGELTSSLGLGYNMQLGPVALNASVYGDWHETIQYDASSAEYNDTTMQKELADGCFYYDKNEDRTLGGSLQASTAYKAGSMQGNVLAGVQFEHFAVTDLLTLFGYGYTGMAEEGDQLVDLKHHENSWSFYAQAKHHFLPTLILNAGLRYDIRYRFAMDNVTNLSPRLALIYTPRDELNLKLTYSQAFVDMSFKYRTLMREIGNDKFQSQYLTALQLSVMGKIAPLHLSYDVNLFYNQFENLHIEQIYSMNNEGVLRNIGLEATATYSHNRLTASMNAYWNKVVKAENYFYSETENAIYAVPKATVNLNVGWKLLQHRKHELKLYGSGRYTSSKWLLKTEFVLLPNFDVDVITSETRLSDTFIMDAGLKYTYANRLTLALDCENLLDTDHFLAGPSYYMYAYHERGRNLMVSASYTF